MKNINIYSFLKIGIVLIGLIITTILLREMYKEASNNRNNLNIESVTIRDTMQFKDSVLNFIFELRLEHPYIVYSQAIIESGNFTSNIWRENNNMFGMKMPERRATLAIGINKGHSIYRNWKECIIDYSLFQMAYLKGLSEDEYFIKIGNSYAEDDSYEIKIRNSKNQYKRSIK